MDFGKWCREAVEILKLDEDAIRRAAADEGATLPAVVFVAIMGLASAVGTFNVFGVVLFPFLIPVFVGIFVGVLWVLARLFGGTASYAEHFRPTGLSYMGQWVSVVPILGPLVGALVGFWLVVVQIVTVRAVHRVSTGAAIAVVLIPLVVCCLLAAGLMVLGVGAAILAGASQAGA